MPATASIRTGGKPVGIQELLTTFDDYPRIVKERDAARSQIVASSRAVSAAEEKRDQAILDLEKEKAARSMDASRAVQERKDAEKAVEASVRGELKPRITELEGRVKDLTQQRSKLTDEISTLRRQMASWISSMERLHKERSNAAEQEKKAEESRMALNEKLRELDTQILEGLKLSSKEPPTPAFASAGSRDGSVSRTTLASRD
ncbi:hypothetical protein BD324DRAFT_679337 [Kockovaella imperatae]|uniref:Uncharacterized protein n=1 Tax=Kockovaella imperatae TaxID=4999 RepID=A0A1Y1UQQ4_9TREE|nr:hypothetical protein BD324DRAFT_679337 [Kockovaella imperatae]ORX40319.1 hypothetical protein BD324DRAFT_679337 [Kockovaella imperatae]